MNQNTKLSIITSIIIFFTVFSALTLKDVLTNSSHSDYQKKFEIEQQRHLQKYIEVEKLEKQLKECQSKNQ